jgi:hypothetical protein
MHTHMGLTYGCGHDMKIGYGCDSDIECVWHNSCTSGRDVSVPFCGACLGGYSEVYGSAKCVPSTQVSNCLSE